MKHMKVMRIHLDFNKQVIISRILYYFWELLNQSSLGLNVEQVTSTHYKSAGDFSTELGMKLLELIESNKILYLLGIATLLDGMHRSAKCMQRAWPDGENDAIKWENSIFTRTT